MIAQNVQAIKKEIGEATLVVVSKYRSLQELQEVYDTGHRILGENRVQELLDKVEALPEDIQWHFIGHLQRNKVKYIVGKVALIHSIDSLRLLNTVQKEAAKLGIVQNVLLQAHIAQEDSKFGFSLEALQEVLNGNPGQDYPNVCIKGVMGMATLTEDQEQIAKEFNSLHMVYQQYASNPSLSFEYCSMGMSGDYPLAIKCGSNMVRVGSKIFS
jgi:pyridoxal phosphate enzyme (YggS family)